MTITSSYRGHPTYFDGESWRYEDTHALAGFGHDVRPCKKCGAVFEGSSVGEPDPCLGVLPGVDNACCGHGDPSRAYVRFEGGLVVKGFDVITANSHGSTGKAYALGAVVEGAVMPEERTLAPVRPEWASGYQPGGGAPPKPCDSATGLRRPGKPSRVSVPDLAREVSALERERVALRSLVGEILATLALPKNQAEPISKLNDASLPGGSIVERWRGLAGELGGFPPGEGGGA